MENNVETQTRTCKVCGQTFPLDAEHFQKAGRGSFQYVCKDCRPKHRRTRDGEIKVNPDLEQFTSRVLIEELRARGYKGKLTYTREVVL